MAVFLLSFFFVLFFSYVSYNCAIVLSHYLLLVLSSFSAWEGCAFSLWPYRDNFMCSFYMKCTNIFLLSS